MAAKQISFLQRLTFSSILFIIYVIPLTLIAEKFVQSYAKGDALWMERCERCGKHWPWTRINGLGLCRSCEEIYLLNLRNSHAIIAKNLEIMNNSDNLEMRWQSGNAAFEKLLRMDIFCDGKMDLYAKVFPDRSLKQALEETEKQLDFLIDAANKIEAVVFRTVTGDNTVPRAEIDKAVTGAIAAGEIPQTEPPINVKTTMYDMLQRLEFEKRLYKRKIASRYIYCLHAF